MAVAAKPKRGEKVGFIRQHPTLKASEVVEAAKKAGIKLTTTLVYNVRASAKHKKGKRTKGKVKAAGFEVGPGQFHAGRCGAVVLGLNARHVEGIQFMNGIVEAEVLVEGNAPLHQELAQVGIEFYEFRGHIELNLRDAKWVKVFARSDARYQRGCSYLFAWDCGFCDRGHQRRSFRQLDLSARANYSSSYHLAQFELCSTLAIHDRFSSRARQISWS